MAECRVCGEKIPEGKSYCAVCDPGTVAKDEGMPEASEPEVAEDEEIKEIEKDFSGAKVEKKEDVEKTDEAVDEEEDKSYFPDSEDGGDGGDTEQDIGL